MQSESPGLSDAQRKKPSPGTFSNLQCCVAGSQIARHSNVKIVFHRFTPYTDTSLQIGFNPYLVNSKPEQGRNKVFPMMTTPER